MSWDKLIISQKSSKIVKEKIIEINSIDDFKGKYIGILPIYWDSLNIYKKNRQNNSYMFDANFKTVDECGNELANLSIDDSVTNIYTTKDKLIILRELYYIKDSYYPVIRYDDSLTFSMRELKKFIGGWLKDNGFTINVNEFELFRIYKMNGFHLFTVIMPSKSNINNSHNHWISNYGMELLPLKNYEIINPFMNVSQYKYKHIINNTNDIWNQSMEGYIDKDNIIPFKIKWSEVLATMSVVIDSDPSENMHLYFKCNIMTTTSELFPKKQKTS